MNTWKRFAPALLAAALAAPAFALHPSSPIPPAANQPMTPVILDPGHGGDDEGAVVHGLMEKDIASRTETLRHIMACYSHLEISMAATDADAE